MSRILWIFARILWATPGYSGDSPGQSGRQLFSGTSSETGLSDRSDRSNPVTSFYPLHGVKQSKSLTFHHYATDSFLLSPVRRPSSTLLSIFTPLEIWSSSPCFGCFITCIGARRGNQSVVKLVLKFLTSSSLFQGITCFPRPISQLSAYLFNPFGPVGSARPRNYSLRDREVSWLALLGIKSQGSSATRPV